MIPKLSERLPVPLIPFGSQGAPAWKTDYVCASRKKKKKKKPKDKPPGSPW